MARNSKNQRRQARERAKLQEAAIAAAAIGVVMLVAPLLVKSPVISSMSQSLRLPGWMALLAGVALFVMQRVLRARETAPTASGKPVSKAIGSAPLRREGTADLGAVATATAKADHVPVKPNAWSAEVFDLIEWRRFEALCEALFGQAGFETNSQSHGADGGIDIWLFSKNHPDGPVSVAQCKRWSTKPVKVAEVRALLGSMVDKKVSRGIFATTSTFTQEALEFARNNRIQTLDRVGLLGLIQKRSPDQQAHLLSVATDGEFWVPTCASCGVKMTRRTPKKGGNAFWGCVNFPKCKTTMGG